MTDLDDLHDQLEQLAARGTIRPSAEVLAAARRSIPTEPRRRPIMVLSVAAAFVLLASGAGWYLVSRDEPVSVTTASESELVESLTVPAVGEVRRVIVAFDRIWVASMRDGWPPVTTIQVFDAHTGDALGEVEAPGPNRPDLVGDVLAMVASDDSLWVRTTTSGPAIPEFGGADNVVFRIDPTTLVAQSVRYLNGDGPLAAHGDRIVAADFSHLEIVNEQGTELAYRTIDEVFGIGGTTVPGANGISSLHFDADGLWVVHDGRRLIAELDPRTGNNYGVSGLGDNLVGGPDAVPTGVSISWITVLRFSGRPPLVVGVRLNDRPKLVHADMPIGRNLLGSIDNGHILVDNPVAVVDVATGQVTPLEPTGSRADLVSSDGETRVAVWAPGEGATEIRFVAVPG